MTDLHGRSRAIQRFPAFFIIALIPLTVSSCEEPRSSTWSKDARDCSDARINIESLKTPDGVLSDEASRSIIQQCMDETKRAYNSN
jgi:hypothetical protein